MTKIEDLTGKRISATKGSSSEREIKARLPGSQVLGFADSSAAYLALQQKKVEAPIRVGTRAVFPPTAS